MDTIPVLTKRWHFYKAALWRPSWIVVGILWTIFANAATFRDNFFSKETQEKWGTLKLIHALPKIPWYWWAIGLLGLSVVVVLESALREVRTRETTHHDTKTRLAEESARNLLPEFAGEIRGAFVTNLEYFQDGNKIMKASDSILLLSVIAWNKRNMSPASVKEYELDLEVQGRKLQGNRKSGQQPTRVLMGGTDANFIIPMSTCLPALSYQKSDGSYVAFYVPGLAARDGIKADLELWLVDLNGNRHKIAVTQIELDYGRLKCY